MIESGKVYVIISCFLPGYMQDIGKNLRSATAKVVEWILKLGMLRENEFIVRTL